jgi:hypothetical protein
MGSWLAEQTATGKTAAEAYRRAISDAEAEYGHQEGYSGAINSKGSGFNLVALPPRFTYRKLQALLEEYEDVTAEVEEAADDVRAYRPGGIWSSIRGAKGRLRKAESRLRKAKARRERFDAKVPAALWNIEGLARTYGDKWEAPLAVELKGAEAKASYAYRDRRRGEKVFVFFGYAPC